jgi:hypothetical protein
VVLYILALWVVTPYSSIDVSFLSNHLPGRAIAQAVSRRLPTAAARVRAQVRLFGLCGGQSGTGAGFLRVLRFPCLFSVHLLLRTLRLSFGAGIIGELVADVPSGLSLTSPQETRKKKTNRLPGSS